MKRLLLLGAALAVFAAPSFAADVLRTPAPAARTVFAPPSPMSGYFEAYGSTSSNDNWGSPYNPWTGGGVAGRLNWNVSPGWTLQADISAQGFGDGYYDGYYWEGDGLAALHLSTRNPNNLLGLFGGFAIINDYYESGFDKAFFVGAEAQAYLGEITLYGQVGYLRQLSGYYGGYYTGYDPYGLIFAQATGRYFLAPNTKLEANLGVIRGDVWGNGSGSTNAFAYGVEIEHRFAMSPVSLFLRAGGFRDTEDFDFSEKHFKVGAKLNFGTGSLKEQDRSGATLKVMDFAPVGWMRLLD